MKEKVQEVLEAIRSSLQADGGDVELIDIEGNTIKVKLLGACGGCPMSQMTLKDGIQEKMQEEVSKDLIVEAVE